MAKQTAPHGTSRVGTSPAGIPSHTSSQGVLQPVPSHSSHRSHALVSDITIAKAIATAVRTTRGVVDLSPGLLALVATYGPNERCAGVVVRHCGPHETAVDVHVTVALEAISAAKARNDAASGQAPTEPPESAVLTQVGHQVREVVFRAMKDLGLAPPSAVDVFIDDIQVRA